MHRADAMLQTEHQHIIILEFYRQKEISVSIHIEALLEQ